MVRENLEKPLASPILLEKTEGLFHREDYEIRGEKFEISVGFFGYRGMCLYALNIESTICNVTNCLPTTTT